MFIKLSAFSKHAYFESCTQPLNGCANDSMLSTAFAVTVAKYLVNVKTTTPPRKKNT